MSVVGDQMPPKKKTKVFKRSFVGCWTCRRRKVKCDAARPHCTRCTRSKLRCEGYDIKLNWISNLVVRNGEMRSLPGSVPMEEVDSTGGVSRSNIELVKWWLYDTYEDMDDDLALLDKKRDGYVGPFTVFTGGSRRRLGKVVSAKRMSSGPASVSTSTVKSKLSLFSSPSSPSNDGDTEGIIDSFKSLTTACMEYNEDITLTKESVLQLSDLILQFIQLTPSLFDETIQEELKDSIFKTMGRYVLTDSPLDQILLLSASVITLLFNSTINDKEQIEKIMKYRHSIDLIFKQQLHDSDKVKDYDLLPLLLLLMIMINSTVSIYDGDLFMFHLFTFKRQRINEYYELFQATNVLINSQQFTFDDKFKLIYADMLDPKYNMLHEIEETVKNIKQQRPWGRVAITTSETPPEQIMRVPKHRLEEQEDSDDEELGPPPTFTFYFSNKMSDDEDQDRSDNDNYDTESIHPPEIQSYDKDNTIFEFPASTTSVYGISSHLVYLFVQMCQLVNHKRYFTKVRMNSRNFAKVCAEFEDLLLLKAQDSCKTVHDERWLHMVTILYFILVKNYPKSRLSYHWHKLREPVESCQSEEFVNIMVDTTMNAEMSIRWWKNNWKIQEWKWMKRDTRNRHWLSEEDKPKDLFIF